MFVAQLESYSWRVRRGGSCVRLPDVVGEGGGTQMGTR